MPIGGKAGFPMTGGEGPGPEVGGAAPEVEPGIRVLVGKGELHESFGTLQAQLVLTAQPEANVAIALASTDPTQAAVFPLKVTFTPEDWAKPQNVFVSGVKDLSADGDQQVTIETLPAVSKDVRYSNLNPADFEVTVIDDTLADVVVGPVVGSTTEAGGTATFSVVLTSKPSAKVVIPLASKDTTEGTVPVELVFDPEAWSDPHTVTITGVDDVLSDGGQAYDITLGPTVSTDAMYDGVVLEPLHVVNVDNE